MSKTFTKALSQKPTFIAVEEPVSGSLSPLTEDATFSEDGSITHNVAGVDNRCHAHMWGLYKLLISILKQYHDDTGKHAIKDEEVSVIAAIAESKLNLGLKNIAKPTGIGNYETTSDIATFVNEIYPYSKLAQRSTHFQQITSNLLIDTLKNTLATYISGTHCDITGNFSSVDVFNGNNLLIGLDKIVLSNSLSQTATCKFKLPQAEGMSSPPANVTSAYVVTLQLFKHDIESSGIAFPYGNIQYKNEDKAIGTDDLDFAHSDQFISVTDPDFSTFINNSDNNIRYDSDSKLYQYCYTIAVRKIDYFNYKFGVDDPSFRTIIGNKTIVASDTKKGCWVSSDNEVTVIPIAIVSCRNLGVYDAILNPGGTAKKRNLAPAITSFTQCFSLSNIAYIQNGSECPNYVTATYNSNNDTYSLAGTTYYRSGTSLSGLANSYIQGSGYSDVVNFEYDVLDLRKKVYDSDVILNYLEQKVIANNMSTDFLSLVYGSVTNKTQTNFFSNKPLQILGFGDSEDEIFGAANIGGLFLNLSNNGTNAKTDTVRRVWSDLAVNSKIAFSFINGNADSENCSILAYEPSSRIITLNTTNLSGIPILNSTYIPTMIWENGDLVVLSLNWSGLGTSSASCCIETTDHQDHSGQKCYCTCELKYAKGNGTPFILSNVVSIKDSNNVEYPFIYSSELYKYSNFQLEASTLTGCTINVLKLNGGVTENNQYRDMYLTILATGETRKIYSYNGVSKEVTLEVPLSSIPAADVKVTIAKLSNPSSNTVIVNAYARGVNGSIKRQLFTATSDGVIIVDNPIISISMSNLGTTGTIKGSVITGYVAGEIVDVIYESSVPCKNSFRIYFHVSQQESIFTPIDQTDFYTIKRVGNLFSTNIGTANNMDESYLMFAPSCTLPSVDDINWVGTSDSQLVALFLGMKEQSWLNIIPFEGAVLNASTMELMFETPEGRPKLISTNQITDDNSGCMVGFLLAESLNTKRDVLLISICHKGNFGFNNPNNVFVLDVNKKYSVKY